MKRWIAMLMAVCMLLSCTVIVHAKKKKTEIEEHVFSVFDPSEEEYLVRTTAGVNERLRFSDTSRETVYKYTVTNHQEVVKLTWSAKLGAQLLLQVSQDDKTWTDFFVYAYDESLPNGQGQAAAYMEFDLTEYVDLSENPDIYIRIADCHPVDGWGGAIHADSEVVMRVEYVPQPITEIEQHGFYVFDSTEEAYLVRTTAGVNATRRFSDISRETVYKYTVTNHQEVVKLTWSAKLGAQLLLQVSQDGKDWTEFFAYAYDESLPNGQGQAAAYMEFDLTKYVDLSENPDVYIRIADCHPVDGWGGAIYATEEVLLRVEYALQPITETEKHGFFVFDSSEDAYLLRTSAGVNTTRRFADGTREVVYKYTVSNCKDVTKITWSAKLCAQLLLQVSQDDTNWVDFFMYEHDDTKPENQGHPVEYMKFDLTDYVDLSENPDIYIRIADCKTSNGWGGAILTGEEVVLEVEYIPPTDEEKDAMESAADERSISFLTCTTPFAAFQQDKQNKVAGASSLVMNVGAGQVAATVLEAAVDATGYDALELELYVSDLALFDTRFANAQLELTSSGRCDEQELGWSLATIKQCIVGEPIVGWNHVVLYFSEAVPCGGSPFDITNVNYFRFFMVEPVDAQGKAIHCDIDLGIDNLRLSKAGVERDEAIALANRTAANTVDEIVRSIGIVTLKSEYTILLAEEEYAALTEEQRAMVTQYDALQAARAALDLLLDAAARLDAENKAAAEKEQQMVQQQPNDVIAPEDAGGVTPVIYIAILVAVLSVGLAICVAGYREKKA